MIDPAKVTKLLADRVTKSEDSNRRQLRGIPYEEEVAKYLQNIMENVCKCTSYEVESETTLDYDDNEEFREIEDESLDPSFDETEEDDKLHTRENFSLDFMKKVIDFYDARNANGRRRHTCESTKYGFKSVSSQQYISRFRHYIE